MSRFRLLRRSLVALALFPALLTACAEPGTPDPTTISRLPAGEQVVLGAGLFNIESGTGFYSFDLTTGLPAAWELQGGRGLLEDGSLCLGGNDQLHWVTDRQELVLSGQLGCADGLYRITADGSVNNVALPNLPPEVEYPEQAILNPAGDLIALVGTVYERKGENALYEAHLYVGTSGETAEPLGIGMGFEHIDRLRWAPDGRAIAFTAGTRPAGEYHRRAYLADLNSGEVYALSEDEALIDTWPDFTPDGAVIFAGAASEGAPPALYHALPGAEAVPVVDLAGLPESEWWRGSFILAPDGDRVVFGGTRANAATPATLYVAELETGMVRDLLPADLPIERSGSTDEADLPSVSPLAWSPDGDQVLFYGDTAGYCRSLGFGAPVGCTDHLYVVPTAGGSPQPLSETHLDGVYFALWLRN